MTRIRANWWIFGVRRPVAALQRLVAGYRLRTAGPEPKPLKLPGFTEGESLMALWDADE